MNKFKRIMSAATLAVLAFLGPALTMAPAHADAGMDAYANSQRAAAGVGALKTNSAMTSEAQAAAERYAASGNEADTSNPHTKIPAGWSARSFISAEGTSTQQAYAAALSDPVDGERMNRASWTDIGSGVAQARGLTYVVIVYATYAPPPAPAAPAPVVEAPAPAPVVPAPAPAPVPAPEPVVEAPPAPEPAPIAEPVVEAPAAPAPEPAPTASATPSETATPSAAPSPSETATAAPITEQNAEQVALHTSKSEADKTVGKGLLIAGYVLMTLALMTLISRLSMSLKPKVA